MALNPKIKDWRGQRVWLIGASSGIGAALAQALWQAGAQVAISARRAEALQTVLAHANGEGVAIPFDASDAAQWPAAHAQLIAQWGGIDLIVFCAAIYQPERTWQLDPARVDATLACNLGSVYYGLSQVLPHLISAQSGAIGIIASVAGFTGLPNASVYGPSKAALINLAEILYADLHNKGLGVFLINPGFVATDLTAKNPFPMPALLTPPQAAAAILRGMARGQFEIHFPRRFTYWLKFLRLLPASLRLRITRKIGEQA